LLFNEVSITKRFDESVDASLEKVLKKNVG